MHRSGGWANPVPSPAHTPEDTPVPSKFTLYKVGANGRIQLGDLLTEGEHYTAELDHDDDGNDTVTLTRVDVVTTSTKRNSGYEATPLLDQ